MRQACLEFGMLNKGNGDCVCLHHDNWNCPSQDKEEDGRIQLRKVGRVDADKPRHSAGSAGGCSFNNPLFSPKGQSTFYTQTLQSAVAAVASEVEGGDRRNSFVVVVVVFHDFPPSRICWANKVQEGSGLLKCRDVSLQESTEANSVSSYHLALSIQRAARWGQGSTCSVFSSLWLET